MPTVLRFRGFNIVIFVDDHDPAHVHVRGRGVDVVFNLNGPKGPVSRRSGGYGELPPNEARAVIGFLNDNIVVLCTAWEAIDVGRYN